MHKLADAGLTTREACFNTVRNVTASPYAGLARDEVFDVIPYVQKVAYTFLRKKLTDVADHLKQAGMIDTPMRRTVDKFANSDGMFNIAFASETRVCSPEESTPTRVSANCSRSPREMPIGCGPPDAFPIR